MDRRQLQHDISRRRWELQIMATGVVGNAGQTSGNRDESFGEEAELVAGRTLSDSAELAMMEDTETAIEPPKDAQVSKAAAVQTRTKAEQIYDSFAPSNMHLGNVDWPVAVWMVAMHAGCLAAPFFFTWEALAVCLVLHWFTGSIGICLGYHRFLSHQSLKLVWPVRFLVTLAGVLSGQGSPLFWAATHRLHHQRSDQYGDPHSPTEGAIWSHLTWLFADRTKAEKEMLLARYSPDLVKDPIMQMFEKTYGAWLIGSGVALYAAGEWLHAGGGWPFLLWGLCVRMVGMYHSTWFVNSATHIWGYRNYDTRDLSRNLWWVAVLSYGEGWHNNHHAHPSLAPAGHKWWEVDVTWWVIKSLKACGLAYEVKATLPKTRAAEEGC
jgi:sn-2 palmitoyl-lipid 9-desaturase